MCLELREFLATLDTRYQEKTKKEYLWLEKIVVMEVILRESHVKVYQNGPLTQIGLKVAIPNSTCGKNFYFY